MDSSPASSRSSIVSTSPSTPPEKSSSFEIAQKAVLESSRSVRARWRPSYHLQPPSGWLNDPCAPFYNPKTGLYHVSFQWNPCGPDWGDISWGSATSPDLTHWTVQERPTLEPNTKYDCEGVFTGCYIPSPSSFADIDDSRREVLTIAYTSVNQLPIHHTLTHVHGSESLSLAQSLDNGVTWQKIDANPILPGEPDGLEVTGWRDPFVAQWPAMSELLGRDPDQTLFGIVSGGIRNRTPTTFLYAIGRSDLAKWEYVGPLVDVGCNLRQSRWSGDLGLNWEVVNFAALKDGSTGDEQQFLIMGTEGCFPSAYGPTVGDGLTRPERCQLWMSGSLIKTSDSSVQPKSQDAERSPVAMKPKAIGHLDHGCLYAANSFYDPKSEKQVVWGWIGEDDLCDELRHAQGWSGMLSLPRELRVQTLSHVIRTRASTLEEIMSIEAEPGSTVQSSGIRDKRWTVRTLASMPAARVIESLRSACGVRRSSLGRSFLNPAQKTKVGFTATQLQTSSWEMSCSIKVSPNCSKTGFTIAHLPDGSSSTTLIFSPQDETITIKRPSLPGPGSNELINSKAERAPHTLFTMLDPQTRTEEEETLDIRVWRDNSVMEVFVNGRTAISTRLYAAEQTFGLHFFAEELRESESRSELFQATLWDGIGLD